MARHRRAWRVGDEQGNRRGDERTEPGRKQQRRVQAVISRERRQRQRRDRDTERLRGLPGTHGQPALAGSEPAHDDTSARCIDRAAGRAGEREHDTQQDRTVRVHGEKQKPGREAEPARHDQPLAVTVGGGTPRDERYEQAGRRSRDDDARLEQAEVLVCAQGGHEHRQAVQEDAGGRLRGDTQREDEPAPHGTATRIEHRVEPSAASY